MKPRKTDARQASLAVLRKLRDAGFAALLAGGCVRDMLLRRTPKDYDVVTDARPEQVLALFPRARGVGQQFGVILVHRLGVSVEVATFRKDSATSDGRRPEQVTFSDDVEDARRRDFTVNGMFYDPIADRVIDHVGGRADLEARIIRTIGDPARRFAEDHLRMLRAVRFAVALDFELDPGTLLAIRKLAAKLRGISAERIWMELERMLTPPGRARAWRLLRETGLAPHLVEEWRPPTDESDRIEVRLAALPTGDISAALAAASLVCERSAEQVRRFCLNLRLSNDLTDAVAWLVAQRADVLTPVADELAQRRIWRAHPLCMDLLELARTECMTQRRSLERWQEVSAAIQALDPVNATPPPLLTGDDLTAAGYAPGPAFGRVLSAVYRAQLNETIRTPNDAMLLAREMLGS
ncbi:MAG: CCA tRNA nucleotidyltransferase [Phycisphaerales bacterium]|nr:CCA tRNA nucleotidyltransferase [Phycisphaerales bacterium]